MKKIVLIAIILLSASVVCAQIPPAGPPVCAECGAKDGEPHKSWCPYAPAEEESESEEEPESQSVPSTPAVPAPTPSASHYTVPASAPTTSYETPDFSTQIHPKVQPRPLFSGINEHSLTVPPTELTSHTQWGEVDLKGIGSFTYDICRYTHSSNTAVVLGHTRPDGTIEWKMLKKYPYGYYNENESIHSEKEGVTITNIHIEAEGRFIFVDYSDGTNRVFDSRGNMLFVSENNEVRLLNFKDGERYFFEVWDRDAAKYLLWTAEKWETELIGISSREIQYLDNAFITYDNYSTTIYDYSGNMLTLEKDGIRTSFFDDVTIYKDDTGYHYVVEVNNYGAPRYAIITSDLKQYGGWYSSMGELQRAWLER